MNRTRLRARPLRTALTLSTVVFLSACTSSAEIEADQRADTAAAAAEAGETTTALQVDTSPEQAGRVRTDEDPDAAALVPGDIAEDGKLTVGVAGSGEPPLGFSPTTTAPSSAARSTSPRWSPSPSAWSSTW